MNERERLDNGRMDGGMTLTAKAWDGPRNLGRGRPIPTYSPGPPKDPGIYWIRLGDSNVVVHVVKVVLGLYLSMPESGIVGELYHFNVAGHLRIDAGEPPVMP